METLTGWRNYETDAALLLVYLVVLPLVPLLPEAWPWALALVMLIDAGTYFKGRSDATTLAHVEPRQSYNHR